MAALITIGGLGHCVGLQSAHNEIAKLESELETLRTSRADTDASVLQARLEDCIDAYGSCRQKEERLDKELRAAQVELASASSSQPVEPAGAGAGSGDVRSNELHEGSSSGAIIDSQEKAGLHIDLISCDAKQGELMCDFAATSTDKDHDEYLRGSRLIENDGKEIVASSQEFGTSRSNGRQVYARLVRGVPIRGSVGFVGIDESRASAGISLIEMRFDTFTAQFRGVVPGRGQRSQ